MKKAYNAEIGVLRFVFAVMIFLVHAFSKFALPVFGDANYAVEFFFFLSGYYLTEFVVEKRNKAEESGESCRNYIAKRFLALLPLIVFSILYGLAIVAITAPELLTKNFLVNIVGDFFLTQAYRLPAPSLSGVYWYLSVLFIGIALLYPVLVKWTSYFVKVLSIILALLLYGVLFASTGNLSAPGSSVGLFFKGFLRGIAGMSVGVFLYGTVERMKNIALFQNKFVRIAGRLIGYIPVFLGMIFLNDSPYLFPLLAPYIIAVAFSLFRPEGSPKASEKFVKFAKFLQALSLPFYLLHFRSVDLADKLGNLFLDAASPMTKWLKTGLAFLIALAVSLAYLFAKRAIKKAIEKRRGKKAA